MDGSGPVSNAWFIESTSLHLKPAYDQFSRFNFSLEPSDAAGRYYWL